MTFKVGDIISPNYRDAIIPSWIEGIVVKVKPGNSCDWIYYQITKFNPNYEGSVEIAVGDVVHDASTSLKFAPSVSIDYSPEQSGDEEDDI